VSPGQRQVEVCAASSSTRLFSRKVSRAAPIALTVPAAAEPRLVKSVLARASALFDAAAVGRVRHPDQKATPNNWIAVHLMRKPLDPRSIALRLVPPSIKKRYLPAEH
jgi:hypothetical protein